MSCCHILTGAGFTKNFGGPLAEEMWSLIFNAIDGRRVPALKNRFRRQSDFEAIYHEVMNTPADDADCEELGRAVQTAFVHIDRVVASFRQPGTGTGGSRAVEALADALWLGVEVRGCWFTLNQDLFVERKYWGALDIVLPGLTARESQIRCSSSFHQPLDSVRCTLPAEGELDQRLSPIREDRLRYVKLHGSCDWIGADGRNRMVLGGGKPEQIEAEPLLRRYSALFERCMTEPGARLLVVGYGFRDPHINHILRRGVMNSGLEISIISPFPPHEFRTDGLPEFAARQEIWRGVSQYFQLTMRDLFSPTADSLPEWDQLRQSFFGR